MKTWKTWWVNHNKKFYCLNCDKVYTYREVQLDQNDIVRCPSFICKAELVEINSPSHSQHIVTAVK